MSSDTLIVKEIYFIDLISSNTNWLIQMLMNKKRKKSMMNHNHNDKEKERIAEWSHSFK